VGKFVVIRVFYIADTLYRLCAVQTVQQKAALKEFIEFDRRINGHKEEDWFRVETAAQVALIVQRAGTAAIGGVVYNLQGI
jgi:hypothetical protein